MNHRLQKVATRSHHVIEKEADEAGVVVEKKKIEERDQEVQGEDLAVQITHGGVDRKMKTRRQSSSSAKYIEELSQKRWTSVSSSKSTQSSLEDVGAKG